MGKLFTWQRKLVDFSNPNQESISVLDIARGLSREYKFNGQSRYGITLAQHSVLVSMIVTRGHEREALFSFASSAYMKDLPIGLRELLPDYICIEAKIDLAIRKKFDLPVLKSGIVRVSSQVALATEYRDLYGDVLCGDAEFLEGSSNVTPLNERLRVLGEDESFDLFMDRYRNLYVSGDLYKSCEKRMFAS